jgi:predicted transposase YbfD/YdcC
MARQPLIEAFATLPDPRMDRTRKHRLDDILMIVLIGLIGGATSFEGLEAFATCREAWLRTFLKLPNGVPSHDTLHRVLSALDPKAFASRFAAWAAQWMPRTLPHIAIDGKSLHGSDANTFCGCMHLVSAWATEQGLLLGQEAVADLSNESTAIPPLLAMLKLRGALVTIDAAGCQKRIAATIRDRQGHYLLCVKANQPKLYPAVEAAFAAAIATEFAGLTWSQHASSDAKHGRIEERYVTVIENPQGLPTDWRDLAAIVQVNRERSVNGRNTTTTHYYISSLAGSAETLGRLIRRHWAIENELNWSLDVVFGEDANRTQDRNASANLGVLRRLAVSLLQRMPGRQSQRVKMIHAAGNSKYMDHVLSQIPKVLDA